MELREKIASTIGFKFVEHGMVYAPSIEGGHGGYCYRDMKGELLHLDALADAILAIPEIAEALRKPVLGEIRNSFEGTADCFDGKRWLPIEQTNPNA